MMTVEDAGNAIDAAGVGWDPITGGVVLLEQGTPNYCNIVACEAYAQASTVAGTSPNDLGLAVLALVEGDDSLLRAILATP